jgi:hypothetical protein
MEIPLVRCQGICVRDGFRPALKKRNGQLVKMPIGKHNFIRMDLPKP